MFSSSSLVKLIVFDKQKKQEKLTKTLKQLESQAQWLPCTLNGICAIKSTISMEMQCPQLSKPEAKKTLGETRLSRGASSPLAR